MHIAVNQFLYGRITSGAENIPQLNVFPAKLSPEGSQLDELIIMENDRVASCEQGMMAART